MPSEAFGASATRPIIGETYYFDNIDGKGLIGTVHSATVHEKEKQVYIGVTDAEGKSERHR